MLRKPKTKLTPVDNIDIVLREKGLVIRILTMPVYLERYIDPATATETQRFFVLLKDGKQTFKLFIVKDEDHALLGVSRETIYIQYKRGMPERFVQLGLADVGIAFEKGKPHPVQEDMGKTLVKVLQINIDKKKAPPTLIVGLTKGLFYMFIFSVIVFSAMYGVNIYMQYAAVNAWQSASSFLSHYLASQQAASAPVP